MDTRVREIIEAGNKLFSQRQPVLSLWQAIAEQFYPERADFTVTRMLGEEYAAGLMTGMPAMSRRDLGNQISAMLRPRGSPWFHARTDDEKINDDSGARAWLDWASDVQRRAMYDRLAQFVRATKQGDHDFAAFGQTVISADLRRDKTGLLYRNWHLRDVAWVENAELQIDHVHRSWTLGARDLVRLFPKTVSAKVNERLDKDAHCEIKCRHVVLPADEYDLGEKAKRRKLPFVSLYIDIENQTVLEEVPVRRINYVIPRWQTVSGSQYAHSPATAIALPDARLLQQITLTLLEAGQKAVDPPMLAVGEAITGGMNLYAGGVTWVDSDYDERLGEVLRPLNGDYRNLQFGEKREERVEALIKEAFFLNQIRMPDLSGGGEKMTAYEVQKRNEEYIRGALPLFEPMETEYNGAICDITFELIMENGGFGSAFDMPRVLRGQDVRFQFESPLQAAATRANAQAFMQSAQLLKIAAEIDPDTVHDFDCDEALRDALEGAGAPAKWIIAPEKAQAAKDQAAQQRMLEQAAAQVGGAADIASKVGGGVQALQAAGVVPGAPPPSAVPQG